MTVAPVEVQEVLLRSSRGVLARARQGGADVVIDTRLGRSADWSLHGPPAAILRPLDETRWEGQVGTVYPRFAGAPLEAASPGPMPTLAALAVVRDLCEAVAWLHHNGRFHLHLEPSHVLLDGQVVGLLGGGHAQRSGREHVDGLGTDAGLDLGYLAPEQTGRVSRPVDQRTDLYGLGALLYRLLAGRAPFASDDRLELLHSVIAVAPPSLEQPAAVQRILRALLAKDALDRYQTAAGLLHDLDRAIAGLDGGDEQDFELRLAEQEIDLPLPDGLYGRDDELAALRAELESSAKGAFVVVSGPAGSGKTALIEQLREGRLQLLWGKFDPSDRGRPYAAVGRALEGALDRVLALPEEQLAEARARVAKALGEDVGVLTPMLPRLEALVGPGAAPAAFDPGAARARLSRSLGALVGALRQGSESPVLVLDDLQWADRATFALLEHFQTELGLRVVGCYRPEEVGPEHPLSEALGRPGCVEIVLRPLPDAAVAAFVSACLRRTATEVAPLSDELGRRTRGNPFALRWALRELHRRGVIVPRAGGGWRWYQERVGDLGVADNIAPLLAARIDELPAFPARVLRASAIAGTWIDPGVLSAALETPLPAVLDALGVALQAELVEAERGPGGRRHRFAHDRIREAALDSLEVSERDDLMRSMGRALLASTEPDPFAVVGLLNPVRGALEPGERARLAEVNLQVAAQAVLAHALKAAARSAEVAWELLGADPWVTDPARALRCRDLTVEASHQLGDRETVETLAREVIDRVTEPADAAHAYDTLLASYAKQERVTDSLDTCYDKLASMGEALPRKPHMGHVMAEMARTMWALRGRTPEQLLEQPPTDDRRVAAITHTVSQMGTSVESAEQYLQVALRGVRVTVRNGPSRGSGFCYSSYGTILCGPFGKLEEGDRYGRLGLALVRKLGARDIENRVMINYYSFVAHWTHPWRESIPALEEARRSALAHGDVTYLPGATMFVTQFRIFSGDALAQTRAVVGEYVEELAGDEHNHKRLRAFQELLALLVEPREGSELLGGFDGLAVPEDQLTTATFHCLRGYGALLLGRWDLARQEFDQAVPASDALFGLPLMPVQKFCDALVSLDAADSARGAERNALIKRARKHRAFLAPRAEAAPFNLAHRVALLDAELARVTGQGAEASERFHAAAELAREHGFVNDEGLIWLRSAAFHEAEGRGSLAGRDRASARRAFTAWGATAVARRLPEVGRSPEGGVASVDVEALVRAGNAIGRELHLDRLLPTLTGLLSQNAGAERVLIVVADGAGWRVEAMLGPDGHSAVGRSLDDCAELLCLPVVRWSLRAGEPARIDDLAAHPEYGSDPYAPATGTRSILTLPIKSQGRTVGLAYLEHRAMRSAFDAEGARAVELLANQIGAALQNATLFERSEGLKRAFERFVPKQMLQVLGKPDIRHVGLGDNVESEMTVLFSDIRAFTRLSESASPKEVFALLNEYLGRMEPIITARGGFIDKYIGDAIMAVFPGPADDALLAAAEMLAALDELNGERRGLGEEEIRIGIGIHTGTLMLGTVGGVNRMEGTVIGDTVNLASRVEGQTKLLGVPMLVTAAARAALNEPGRLALRSLGAHAVRGRDEPVELFTLAE